MHTLQVAISGSSGLIGSALGQRLISDGHQVHRLVRPGSSSQQDVVDFASDIEWDPQTGLKNPERLSGFDAVVHLAGRSIASHRWSDEEKQRLWDSRVPATATLAEQLGDLATPPKAVVSCSATGIYGDCGSRIVDESTDSANSFLGRLSSQWEEACLPLAAAGVRVVHPRLGIVLSPHGGALQRMLPIFRTGLGGRLGSGSQYWSWIALEDCLRGLEWLISNGSANGPYNFVSPNPVTNAEFTNELAEALHRPALLPAPKFGLRLALGEMADALLLCSCRALPDRLLAAGFEFEHPLLGPYLATGL